MNDRLNYPSIHGISNTDFFFVFAFLFKKSITSINSLLIFLGPFGDYRLKRFPPARKLGALRFMILLEFWKIEVGI